MSVTAEEIREFQLAGDMAYQLARVEECPRECSGDGCVIVGGGRYLISAYVTARMLRLHAPWMPAQVWHLGPAEMPPEWGQRFAELRVEPVDAFTIGGDHAPGGYALKAFAVERCPWERVLMLDADSYPVAPLDGLFGCSRADAHGAVFYPDAPFTDRWTDWDFWGVKPYGPACGWETGQYLIDKRRHWPVLRLARWYDEQGELCYRKGPEDPRGDHGDKGPWRVAFARFRREPAFYSTFLSYWPPAVVHPGPNGRPLFVHRTRDKFRLTPKADWTTGQLYPTNRFVPELPGEKDAWAAYFDVIESQIGGA
jgi:hypothetical protein